MRESAGKESGKLPGKTGKTGKCRSPEPGKTGKHPLGGFPFPGGSGGFSRQIGLERLEIARTYEAADRASGMERRCLLHLAAVQSQELRERIEQERAA